VYTLNDVRTAAAAFLSERPPAAPRRYGFVNEKSAYFGLGTAPAVPQRHASEFASSRQHVPPVPAGAVTAVPAPPRPPVPSVEGEAAGSRWDPLMAAFNDAIHALVLEESPGVVEAILADGADHPRHSHLTAAMASHVDAAALPSGFAPNLASWCAGIADGRIPPPAAAAIVATVRFSSI
jgi:hypothetical protein